jgi:hypothetical protein
MRAGRALAIAALVAAVITCGKQMQVPQVAPVAAQPSRRPTFKEIAEAREYSRLSGRYDDIFQKYTKRFFGPAFDWRWFKAQAYAESALNPGEVSWVGARGLMQLMPATYREIRSEHPEYGPIDQPEWNIAAGIFYNSKLWNWWHFVPDANRYHFMFGSYNAGTGNIYKAFTASTGRNGDSSWAGVERVAPTIRTWKYTETLAYVRHIDTTYRWLTDPFARSLMPPAPQAQSSTETSSNESWRLDWPFDRRAPRREHLRAGFGDVQAVLEPNAELAVDRDRRLVAEAHARLDLRGVALHEVGPLVPVETDAVPRPMGKSRHLVPGTEARVADHLSRRGVD